MSTYWSEKLPTSLAQVPYTVYPGPIADWWWDLTYQATELMRAGNSVSNVLEELQPVAEARWAELSFPVMEHMYQPPQ